MKIGWTRIGSLLHTEWSNSLEALSTRKCMSTDDSASLPFIQSLTPVLFLCLSLFLFFSANLFLFLSPSLFFFRTYALPLSLFFSPFLKFRFRSLTLSSFKMFVSRQNKTNLSVFSFFPSCVYPVSFLRFCPRLSSGPAQDWLINESINYKVISGPNTLRNCSLHKTWLTQWRHTDTELLNFLSSADLTQRSQNYRK